MITHVTAISLPQRTLMGVALLACTGLAGCDRSDEASIRSHAGQWFALGETMAFDAQSDCAAGAFRLVHTQVGSGLPIVGAVPQALRTLKQRDAVALRVTGQPPDAVLSAVADADQMLGLKLRAIALEARLCMDETAISALGLALVNDRALLAFDASVEMLMFMDPDTQVLVVTMGAG